MKCEALDQIPALACTRQAEYSVILPGTTGACQESSRACRIHLTIAVQAIMTNTGTVWIHRILYPAPTRRGKS